MRTNNNTYVHAQMLGAWSGADRKSPERAYVNWFDSPAACVSSTIYTSETELQDNRFAVKAIGRVNKDASSNSVHEKDHSRHPLMGFF